MPRKRPKAPLCQHCPDVEAVLVGGEVIYPRRGDLHAKFFWRCPDCGAYCGCHPGTKKALGRPANKELREARMKLHNQRVDPLWRTAIETGNYHPEDARAAKMITNAARSRTYAFLAEKLGIDVNRCHIAMFDIDMCRRAWSALFRVSYPEIRDWAKSRQAAQALDVTNEEAARL